MGPECPVKYIDQGQTSARGTVASADLSGEWALRHPGLYRNEIMSVTALGQRENSIQIGDSGLYSRERGPLEHI